MRLMQGDCLGMAEIPAGSVDLVACDLPYGATKAAWDRIIDLDRLWVHYRRVLKPSGVVALTATQPFTTDLVSSNRPWFRYDVWDKRSVTGHLDANRRPLRRHESILIFAPSGRFTYNPRMVAGKPRGVRSRRPSGLYGIHEAARTTSTAERYPTSIIEIPQPRIMGGVPTQKPVALMARLIATYSNLGDVVLDNAMSSGTTGEACVVLDRRFIELDAARFASAEEKIRTASGAPAPV